MSFISPLAGGGFVLSGPVGLPGRDGGEGAPGRDGGRGEPGPAGPAGVPGGFLTGVASVEIPGDSFVVSVGSGGLCAPANPNDPTHRGRVLGIVHAAVPAGGTVTIQTGGELRGLIRSLAAGAVFVGVDGGPTNTAPTVGWRQQVGTCPEPGVLIVTLGEASAVYSGDVALLLPNGGFAPPASINEAKNPLVTGKWVDPAGLNAALADRIPEYTQGRHFGMPPFHAVGDGVTDDTAAIAAAYAAGVYKGDPTKIYYVTALPAITAANAFIDQGGTRFKLKPGVLATDAGALIRIAGPNLLWNAPTVDGNQAAFSAAPSGSPLLVSLNGCPNIVCFGLHVLNSPSRGFAADTVSGRFIDFRCEGNAGLGAEFNRCLRVHVSRFALNRNGCGFQKTKANAADIAHDFVGFGVAVRYRSHADFVDGEALLNGRDGINFNQGSSGSVTGRVVVSGNDDGGITLASDMVGSGIPGDGEDCHDITIGPDVETSNNYTSGVCIYSPSHRVSVRGRHYNNHRNAGDLAGQSSFWNAVYVAAGSTHIDVDVYAYDDRPTGTITAVNVSGADITLAVTGATFTPSQHPRVAFYDGTGAFRGFGKLTNATPSVRATAFDPVDITRIAPGWTVTAGVQHTGVMCDNGVTASVSVRGFGYRYGTSPAIQGRALVSGGFASGQNVIAQARSRGRELLGNPSFDTDLGNVIASYPDGGGVSRETGANRRSPGSLNLSAGSSDAIADLGLISDGLVCARGEHIDVSVLALSFTGGAKLVLIWQIPGSPPFSTEVVARAASTWQPLRIGADIPDNATDLRVRMFVPAGKTAWFDEASCAPVRVE